MSKRLPAALLALVFVGFVVAAWAWSGLFRPAPPRSEPAVIRVEQGTSLRDVARQLDEQGVVRNRLLFQALARWRGLDRRLRVGEYEIPGGLAAAQVLDALAFGKPRTSQVTIPEGLSMDEIAKLLGSRQLGDPAAFKALFRDPAFIATLGLPGPPSTLEGYLFPDTYEFRVGVTPNEIATRMTQRFREVLSPDLAKAASDRGLSIHQALTLASIVEKEAAVASERPTISAVFHNRLAKGMPLQSDPTAIYGLEGHDSRVRPEDLDRASPYNTYRIQGLPPGPIANPGKASIEAAVRPEPGVEALYFVARNDRTHVFSKDYGAHRAAIARLRHDRAAEARAARADGRAAEGPARAPSASARPAEASPAGSPGPAGPVPSPSASPG
ncbi:MAG: endolytic transglycosylase MltG [Alphaproteobacteria bacterium]